MNKRRFKFASVVVVAMMAIGSAAWAQGDADATKNSGGEIASASTAPVHYYTKQQVEASFAKTNGGDTLYDGDKDKQNFILMTSVRTVPGNVEIHKKVTDVWYIVQGSATILTGGTASDFVEGPKNAQGKSFSKDEIRAHKLVGGEPHHLTVGDVIVIPNGVPHLFTEIDGQFLYHLVKIRQP